jgi:hypothetical protein
MTGGSTGGTGGSTALAPQNDNILTSSSASPSVEQVIFQTGITNLIYATRHSRNANYQKVMVNIQLVVFALCWFGMVSPTCLSKSIIVICFRVN